MRSVRLTPGVDLNRKLLLQRDPTRFGVLESGSRLRLRGIVLLHRLNERLRRYCLRLMHRGLDLGGRPSLQRDLLCCERVVRVVPACLQVRGRPCLQRRDLGRMRAVGLTRGVDLNGEIPLQRDPPRFGVLELNPHVRKRGGLRLQLCDLGRVRRLRLTHRVDLTCEVLLQRAPTRFGLFEVGFDLHERGLVLLRRFGRRANRIVSRLTHRCLELRCGASLELFREYVECGFCVVPGRLELLARLRLQRRHLGRMRRGRLAHGVDLSGKVLLQDDTPRFGGFEFGSRLRQLAPVPAGQADEFTQAETGKWSGYPLGICERHRHLAAGVRDGELNECVALFEIGFSRQHLPSWIGLGRSRLGPDGGAHTELIG